MKIPSEGHEASQEHEEIEVFMEFLQCHPHLNLVDQTSIRHGKADEPDILCKLHDGRPCAFELTEAVHPADRQLRMKMLKVCKALEEEWRKRLCGAPDPLALRCVAIYWRVTTMNSAIRWIPQIVQTLMALECGFRGEVPLGRLREPCENITVGRSLAPNAEFNCYFGLAWVGDTTKKQVDDKFGKKYGAPRPELLVFFSSDDASMVHTSLPETKDFVERETGNSCFSRVWIWERGAPTATYVYPP